MQGSRSESDADDAFPDNLKSDLTALVEDFDRCNPDGWRPIRVLKERDGERTELQCDDQGRKRIRKLFCRHDDALQQVYRTLSHIDSPYIVRIQSVEETPDGIEIIRDFVEGRTLREVIDDRGPLSDGKARTTLIEIARGVQALHTCTPSIIHRDLNPNNIVMGKQGVRIIDFGIARTYKPTSDKDTHTWGTRGYAAPEQFGFGQSDKRTDVFALGMLYWFLLTGTDPAPNLERSLSNTTADHPGAALPEQTRQIIRECTAIAPEKRFANVDALITALQWPATADNAAVTAEAASPRSTAQGPLQIRERTRAAGIGTTPKHPRRKRSLPAKIWLVASTSFMALLTMGGLQIALEPWRLSYPEALARACLTLAGVLVFFAPAWLLSTNLFGICDKASFFETHRILRCVLAACAGMVVGGILITLAASGLSPEYLQALHANGADSV